MLPCVSLSPLPSLQKTRQCIDQGTVLFFLLSLSVCRRGACGTSFQVIHAVDLEQFFPVSKNAAASISREASAFDDRADAKGPCGEKDHSKWGL
jgi:hypothetical protein